MGLQESEQAAGFVPGVQAGDLRQAFDAMVELAVFHEITVGAGGQAEDYRILDCNAAFTRVTGIARGDAVGRLASQVYGGAPPYLDVYARVAATGQPARFESYFPPLDRHFSISAVSPRRGCFVTIATDVTEQHRTVQALRRYQLLAERGLDIVLFVGRESGRIVDANEAAVAAYGFTRDELRLRTIYDLRAQAEWGLTAAQMAAADVQGIRFESVHRRKDGSTFPVEVSSRGALLDGERLLVSVIRDVSERKAAHEVLLSERARLAVTLHSIGDAVIATDEAARITLLNGVAAQLTGWEAKEAAGRPLDEVFRIVHEESRHPAANPVHRVLREGCTVELANHTALIARDGSERPIADCGAPIRDEAGRVSGAVLVFRDQTVKRRSERALEQSEARYRGLFENLAEEVTIYEVVRDPGGRVVDWIVRTQNKQARAAQGPARGSLEGKRITEILETGEASRLVALSRVVMRTGVPATGELFLELTRRHYQASLFALDERTLVTAALDVTARKEAEQALATSEERFRVAFETSPDAIDLDRVQDGVYVAVNQGFTRILGWPEDEVLGRSSLELGIWADAADRERLVALLRTQGTAENFEVQFRARDGRLVPGLMSARVVQLRGEQLILSITRDVSGWRRAEAERAGLQARLQEAAKLEAIGRLAGGVAHDFNNLLTVILSCAETARGDLDTGRPVGAAELEEISAAGFRARDLTRQLLAVARRQVSSPEPLDLGAVVRGCERLLRRVLGEDVELEVACQPGLWLAHCDPGQVEQIIMNLAVNARDAMPGGGRLAIEVGNFLGPAQAGAGPAPAPAEYVRLRVRDSGEGMPASIQEQIFEPFFTTKEPGLGTGLGLATVYGIVKQRGGTIQVESEVGRGTTFEIRFPRIHGVAAGAPDRAAPATVSGSERVLLVEDDRGVREVALRALRDGGYQVQAASGPAEALASAAGGARFDLLVSDVVMPRSDGRKLAAALRLAQPGLRVLFISGHAERILAHGGVLEAGIEFLPKPFTPAALLAKVREVLDA
jgi:two-component system, cell cycle sensor histidine kinase and response regulator CckA